MILLVVVIGSTFVFFFIGLLNLFLINITKPNSDGDTPVSTTIPAVSDSTFPDLGTLILIFTGVAIPILVTITIILYRLSKSADNRHTTSDDNKPSFYCQQCGSNLNWDTERCPYCGKNTDDERNLISRR